jgi:hypothetical protein
MVYYSVVGLEQLIARLAVAQLKTKPAMARAVKEFADGVMADSKAKYVPVGATARTILRFRRHGFRIRGDDHAGALRDSGKVEDPVISPTGIGTGVSVRLSYGGGGVAAPYAIAVHEHLSQYSPRSWKVARSVTFNQGGPKYLERPLMEHSRHLPHRVSNIVSLVFW